MSNNGHIKTLVEEVFDTMPGSEKDIGAQLSLHRVLLWFRPLKTDSSCLMRLVSNLSKRMDWEQFEPGSAPILTLHSGSIYSFKEFAVHHTGINECDAVVLGTSSGSALEAAVSIVESMALEQFIKFDLNTEAVSQVMHIIPLTGILCFDTWIEPSQANADHELVDRRHEATYGLEIKRPRDCVEADLFSAKLDEPAALKLLLKVMARKARRRLRQPDGILRCWDLLSQARELMSSGCVNEAGIVASTALEELLIVLTNVPHEHIKRDRLVLGKIISMVEKNKRLHPVQTKTLREYAELRTQCVQALTASPRSDGDLRAEINKFIEWLDSYPDWLK